MIKMLRNIKKFGRCKVQGHNNCEVIQEIQSQPISRSKEKRDWKKEIEKEMRL